MKIFYRTFCLFVFGTVLLFGSATPAEPSPKTETPGSRSTKTELRRLFPTDTVLPFNAQESSCALYSFAVGLIYEIDEDFDPAVSMYSQVNDNDPGTSRPLIRIGLINLSQGHKEKALEAFDNASQKEPLSYYPLFLKGTVLSDMGKPDEAVEALNRAIELGPEEWMPHLALGEISLRKGDLEQAQKSYTAAVSRAPRFSMAWFKLGSVELKLKNLEAAVKAFEMAVKISPALLEPRIALALTLEKQGNKDRAIEVYKELLKINPLNTGVYTKLATLYDEQGSKEEAEHLYEILIELEPRNLSGYLIYGYYLLEKKEYDKALSIIVRGQTRQILSPQLDYLKGTLHLEAGNPQKAVEAFNAALSRYDGDMEIDAVYFALGTAYERLGKIEDAAAAFRKTLEIKPDMALAHNYIGYMFADAGVHLDEALEHINRALELEPENGAFLDSKGWVLFKLGQIDSALEFLELADRKLPDDEVILEHLGDVWMKKGNRKKALVFWNKSFKIDKSNESLLGKIREKGNRGKL